jgi:site-specific recombinase XerD
MASVRELKTTWQLRFYDESRTPTETTQSVPKSEYTEAQAREEAGWRQHLYDRGEHDPWVQDHPGQAAQVESLTLQEAVERYVEKKRAAGRRGEKGGWSEKTYRSDAQKLRAFALHAGPRTLLSNVRRSHVQNWVYQDRLAGATKRGRWILLRAMFGWMEDRGWMDAPENTQLMPGKPQARRKIRVTLTPEQLEKLCTAYDVLMTAKVEQNKHTSTAGVSWHTDAWRLTYYQGFRRSELLELRVRNVLLEEEMIQVGDKDYQQKGQRETLIPLTRPAKEILKPYVRDSSGEARDRDERVFNTPQTNDRVSKFFRRTVDFAADPTGEATAKGSPDDVSLQEADVPFEPFDEDPSAVDFYTLRHSCATYWLRQRRRLIWVNRLLRHKDISTTMEYVHLLPTDLRAMYQTGAS